MTDLVYNDWLFEQDMPVPPTPPSDPNMVGDAAPPTGQDAPSSAEQPVPPPNPPAEQEDISGDPQTPDMPEEQPEDQDFHVWKHNFEKESIKGDVSKMKSMLSMMRKRDLNSYQSRYVRDNWNIILLREYANINAVSKDIRRMIKDQIDRNNPATSVANYMTQALESHREVADIFIKLIGYGGLKTELHRKLIASLLGAVQLGVGSNTDNITYFDREYTIAISTRYNAKWGNVIIGPWSLEEQDPEKYLSEAERNKLSEGSPEERDVLRRRVVIESIAEKFKTRSFIINVVSEDGTIYFLGWDIAGSLRNAYESGKIVVKTRSSGNSEAMIDESGQIVPAMDWIIYYVKHSGEQDINGKVKKKIVPFIVRRNGNLILVANDQTIRDASSGLSGIAFKEMPYQGNPSDLPILRDCVYTAFDLLMRTCNGL